MHTPEDAAAESSLDADQIRTLGTILGYPGKGEIGEGAHRMLAMVGQMVAAGFPYESILEGARVYADATRRMAEAGIQMTHRFVCEPLERSGSSPEEVARVFDDAGAVAGPSTTELVTAMYQMYMDRALEEHARTHLEARDADATPGTLRRAILFIDLALFTSLTDTFGDEEAIRVLDRLDQCVREYSLRHDGSLVKQIGDEFMLAFKDPANAVRFAIDLHETMSKTERFVAPRTGIHSGSVLYRMGDYYGHAVNVAARIVSMAMANAILVTEPVAKAAADAGIAAEEVGVRSLRGMEEPLSLYRVVTDREG